MSSFLTEASFFRKYANLIVEAESVDSNKEAIAQINKLIMQAAKESAGGKQIEEGALNEGIMSKLVPLIAAATIGMGASGAAHADRSHHSIEQGVDQYGQVVQRECVERAREVADLIDQYGRVLATHPEIVKQCGPYIVTGQPIVVQETMRGDGANVAAVLIGVLGAAAIINNIEHHGGGGHGGYNRGGYERHAEPAQRQRINVPLPTPRNSNGATVAGGSGVNNFGPPIGPLPHH